MHELLTLAVFCALMLWLLAGITLRMLAQQVRQYASDNGSPGLARTVRLFAISLLSITIPLLLYSGWAVLWITLPMDMVLLVIFLGIVIHLAALGGFLLRWSNVMINPSDQPNDVRGDVYLLMAVNSPLILMMTSVKTAQRGASLAFFTSWWMLLVGLLLSLAFAVATSGSGGIVFEVWLGLVVLAGLFEIVAGYFGRLHQRHLSLWQIYLAIVSRRPLAAEVELLARTGDPSQRRRLIAMSEELHEGVEAEDVFAHSSMLSSLEGAYLAGGLRAGQLPEVLSEILKRRTEFADRLQASQNPLLSVFYLWMVVLTLNAVVGFISYWIIPKFKKIFDDFGMQLPSVTLAMTRAADSYANYWFLVVPLLLIGLVSLTVLTLFPFAGGMSRLREWLTWLWPRICLPDVLRTLAVAVRAKLPIEEAFVPLVRRQLRVPLHNRLVRFQELIRDGNDCWISMADERFLKPAEAQFLRSAEKAGNLPWALEILSSRFEQRWRFWLLFGFEFLQPMLVLVLGLIVSFIAIAYFMPLVKLINDLA